MTMKTIFIRIIYILGGFVLSLIALFAWFYFSAPKLVVDSSAESPDKRWMAQASEESWGLSGGHYFVTLANDDKSAKVLFDFMPPDSGPFEVRWLDTKNLEIEYPGAMETYTKLGSYQDIAITYLECPIKKRGIGSKKCIR